MSAKIKCFYQNTRGLRSKIAHGLRNRITTTDYDVIALTETWLNNDFDSESIFDSGLYTVHRSDRTNRTYTRPTNSSACNEDLRGGGSLIALNKNIPALRMSNWELESPFDNVWLRISTSNTQKIFINCIYINDKTTFDKFITYLDLLHEIINQREPNAKFLILGDFNLSCIDWYYENHRCIPINHEGRMARELINTMTCTNIAQSNHIRNNYGRILDLVLSNATLIECKRAIGIVNEDPYHPAISFNFDSSNITFMKQKRLNKLNFFKADYISINSSLEAIDWNLLFQNLGINEAVDIYYSTINTIIKRHTPTTTSTSNQYPIWYSRKLIGVIQEKEVLFNLKKTTKHPTFITLHKQKRKEYKWLKKKCLYDYESNIESKVKDNPKCFFAYTKSLKRSNHLPAVMKFKNDKSENMKDTTNLFAKYFSSVYSNSTVPNIDFNCNNNCNDYFPISLADIEAIIGSLDQNKINSPDGIPTIFYKNTIKQITRPLLLLFKLSASSMKYPDKWKISHITPIHKSGDTSNVENYRPISILSAVAKIFDKLLHQHILDKTKHLISMHQHGFSKGKSTLTNLMEYVNFIANNMPGGGQIDVILMDLAKAFDKINHNRLLQKLSALPLDPCLIILLKSYLSQRKQYIYVFGEKSECIIPGSSVPQGSILSPLLFALFINDLAPLIKSIILLFADDVKIFRKINSHVDARTLQNDINTIYNWCNENFLELNINKCNSMTFTRKPPNTTHQFVYNINNISLQKISSCKDLGVTFDSKLSFELHYKNITSRAYKMLGFISRSLNRFRQMSTYTTLYNTYVRSIVEYCSPIWSPYYDIHTQEIERVQRRFTRMVYKKFQFPMASYESRLMKLELISLENRRLMFDEITLYKINNELLRTSLNHSLSFGVGNRVTRQNITFYLPAVTTNIQFFAPMLRFQRQHNDSFNHVQLNEPSINAFKRCVYNEVKQIQMGHLR